MTNTKTRKERHHDLLFGTTENFEWIARQLTEGTGDWAESVTMWLKSNNPPPPVKSDETLVIVRSMYVFGPPRLVDDASFPVSRVCPRHGINKYYSYCEFSLKDELKMFGDSYDKQFNELYDSGNLQKLMQALPVKVQTHLKEQSITIERKENYPV